jgi:hypothetical protein
MIEVDVTMPFSCARSRRDSASDRPKSSAFTMRRAPTAARVISPGADGARRDAQCAAEWLAATTWP